MSIAQPIRVLIAEDNILAIENTRSLLTQLEYIVVGTAANGVEAVNLTEALHPDVVLMDLRMPTMDGIEAAHQIQHCCPTPVVILTAHDTSESLTQASAAGVGAYLTKPPTARELERAITISIARFDDIISLRHLNAALQTEITERNRIEDALRESEERFRTIFETAQDFIFIKDLTMKYTHVNPAMERLFGMPATELIGRTDKELFGAEAGERIKGVDERVLNGEIVKEEATKPVNGVPKTFHVVKVPMRNAEGTIIGLCGIARDITERKQVEEELRDSYANLQQFAYIISHDLQEPLRMVTSFLKLLRETYAGDPPRPLDDEALEYIWYAVDGAKRMKDMIQALLLYSRVGTRGKAPTSTDSQTVLETALVNLMVTIKETNAQVTHDPLPTVLADKVQLEQVFQNLISNAIKFRGEKQPRVHITAEEEETTWRFSVRDNGIGIEPELISSLFQIFQRLHTREEYPGTGIGLAICKKIVERHGGKIWVESALGEGSTFYFTLPKA